MSRSMAPVSVPRGHLPSPSETWFRGMSVGGFSGRCRAGITLERCSQLAAFVTQPIGLDAAAVWVVEDGVPRCVHLPSSNLVPFGRWRHERGTEHRRREPGSALSSGYAFNSAKAKASSIVDKPGEC